MSVVFILTLAAPVFAIELPKGKSGRDFVKEAKAHSRGILSEETKRLMDSGNPVVLLDIRSFAEFKKSGWIAGRTVMPHGLVIFAIRQLVPDKNILIIICGQKDKRSAMVAYQLQQMGYENVRYLKGGVLVWKRKGLPLITSGVSKIANKAAAPKGEMPTGKRAADFVAEANRAVKAVGPREAKRMLDNKGGVLLDIRSAQEIESQGGLAGALIMEQGMVVFIIAKKVHDANTPIIVVCRRGKRSAIVAQQLQEMGYKDVHHVEGGFLAWKKVGLPVK